MKILSVKQTAEMLNQSIATIHKYIRLGGLPAHYMGGKGSRILIYEHELNEWLKQREPVKHSREITLLTGEHLEDMRQRP